MAVTSTFTADTSSYLSAPLDKLYSGRPASGTTTPTAQNYRSCVGGDAKAGGTVVTTYTVKIISGAGSSQTLNSLLYDFSGSSFHYNADFAVGGELPTSSAHPRSRCRRASPQAITPGSTSTLTFQLANPTAEC